MSEYDVNMPEYVWIYDNRQGSEYVSYNCIWCKIWLEVTPQVNEYLLIFRTFSKHFGKTTTFAKELDLKYLRGFSTCVAFQICQSSKF